MENAFGMLLRQFREQRTPDRVGILASSPGLRRTPGLRREELAESTGLSCDHLKRLESGHRRPSRAAVEVLASALRLNDEEYERLNRAAGFAGPAVSAGRVPREISPPAGRLLQHITEIPVCVTDAMYTVLQGNPHFDDYGCVTPDMNRRERNVAWRVFMTEPPPQLRAPDRLIGFQTSMIADLQRTVQRYPADVELACLVEDLRRESALFARLWSSPPAPVDGADRLMVSPSLYLERDAVPVDGDLRVHLFTRA